MVFELLHEGAENAMSKKQLCETLGISPEHLRVAVARERAEGALILSSTKSGHGGYFRPKDISELAEFVKTESNRAKSVFLMLKPARLELKRARQRETSSGSLFEDVME